MECIPVLPYYWRTIWDKLTFMPTAHTHALFDSFTHATFSPFFFADDISLLPNTCSHMHMHMYTLTWDSEKTAYQSIPLKMHNQKRRHTLRHTHTQDQIVHATILSFIFYDFSRFRIELLPNKWISSFFFFLCLVSAVSIEVFRTSKCFNPGSYWLYTIGLNGGKHSNGTVAIYIVYTLQTAFSRTENTEESKKEQQQ